MTALRWIWDVGLFAGLTVGCLIACAVSLLLTDDPAHVWIAYMVGFGYFGEKAIEAAEERARRIEREVIQ